MSDTMVKAVLLVPAAGYEGLLAEGPCGYRPPTTMHPNFQAWDDCDNWEESGPYRDCPPISPCSDLDGREREKCMDLGACRGWNPRRALVLAWRSKPVAAGIELAMRHGAWPGTRARVLQRLKGGPGATYVVPPEMGTVIMLDGDGREVSLETVWAVTP